MAFGDEAIVPLRAALELSPGNLPLRLHLIRTLRNFARFGEAETESRAGLAQAPQNMELKLELALAFFQQAKQSQAEVLCEDLVKQRDPPAVAYVLYAKVLFRNGDVANAVAQYKNGIELSADAADREFADQLGISPSAVTNSGEVFDGRVRERYDADSTESPTHDIERPKTRFQDVGGMHTVKEEISLKIILPLKHPELFQAYGKSAGGGILLYGPPGCGKTHLARATAGEIQAGFISIGINDVLDMWIGSSEKNLHAIFEQARDNTPCVLFFDEVDALGGRRSDHTQGGGRNMINQFLAEMDGIQQKNSGLLVLAATNAPWHVDPAFRRPGRFDRVVFVPPPDDAARQEILQIHCQGKPCEPLDFKQLAKVTDQFSGADLKAVVDTAIEAKLREAIKAGGLKPLTTKDLLAAAKQLKSTTKEWFATARNYALYSNQGGAYDDVLKYLKMT